MDSSRLPELREVILSCRACPLRDTCSSPVPGSFGSGPEGWSGVMIVGEAPGAVEDSTGVPFSGRSGRLLRRAVGNDHYFTNAVKCRPPKNRRPRAREVDACIFNLISEIIVLSPRAVILAGRTSASVEPVISRTFPGLKVIEVEHPAAVLRRGKRAQEMYVEFLSGVVRKL